MKHGASFSAAEYCLWAKFIDLGGHNSKEEPPKESIFKRKSPGTGIKQLKCSAAVTATITCPPTKEVGASANTSSSLTPRSAAY